MFEELELIIADFYKASQDLIDKYKGDQRWKNYY